MKRDDRRRKLKAHVVVAKDIATIEAARRVCEMLGLNWTQGITIFHSQNKKLKRRGHLSTLVKFAPKGSERSIRLKLKRNGSGWTPFGTITCDEEQNRVTFLVSPAGQGYSLVKQEA